MKYSKQLEAMFKSRKDPRTFQEFLDDIEKIVLDFIPQNLKLEAKDKLSSVNIATKLIGSSSYDYYTNTVNVLNGSLHDTKSFVHELFHAIGTNVEKNIVNIGLMQLNHVKVGDELTEIKIGRALNEGANTFFTSLALQNTGMADDNANVALSYCFMANIFSSLCALLGLEECKYAHFSGGLPYFLNLIRKECNRTTDSKAVKLMLSMDTYFSIQQVNGWIGIDFTPDSKEMLFDAYKALVDLYFFKFEKHANLLKIDQIITDFYLSPTHKEYLDKFIKPRLVKYLEKRILKEYSDRVKNCVHMDLQTIQPYVLDIIKKAKNGEDINGNNLPEKLKCGEFYNYLLTCVSIIDSNFEREGLKTNDIQQIVTKALFEKSNNFMPKEKDKRIQTLIDILASRCAVRAGIEVSDELILDALSESKKFNFYLMDSNPEYYKQLYSQINGDIKFNDEILCRVVKEFYTSRVDHYKLKKMLENSPEKQKFVEELIAESN